MAWPFPKPAIPIPEDLEDRLPFIFRNFVDPCDAPITVWAEAFLPAFINALIAWYTVDLVQIVRTMWKPPLFGWRLRSGGHRGGSSGGKKRTIKSIAGEIVRFDPNEWVGNALNPFAEEEMIMVMPGEVLFWTGLDLIVVAAFYYSILDIGSGFLYEWTAAVAQTKYCRARDDAVGLYTAIGYPLQGIFGWDAVGMLAPVKQRHIDFFNGFGVMQTVGPGVVGFTFGYVNTGGGAGTPWIEARMNCLTGPRAGTYHEHRVAEGDGASGKAGSTYDCYPGETWIGEIRVNGTWFISDPTLFIHANGYKPT